MNTLNSSNSTPPDLLVSRWLKRATKNLRSTEIPRAASMAASSSIVTTPLPLASNSAKICLRLNSSCWPLERVRSLCLSMATMCLKVVLKSSDEESSASPQVYSIITQK